MSFPLEEKKTSRVTASCRVIWRKRKHKHLISASRGVLQGITEFTFAALALKCRQFPDCHPNPSRAIHRAFSGKQIPCVHILDLTKTKTCLGRTYVGWERTEKLLLLQMNQQRSERNLCFIDQARAVVSYSKDLLFVCRVSLLGLRPPASHQETTRQDFDHDSRQFVVGTLKVLVVSLRKGVVDKHSFPVNYFWTHHSYPKLLYQVPMDTCVFSAYLCAAEQKTFF